MTTTLERRIEAAVVAMKATNNSPINRDHFEVLARAALLAADAASPASVTEEDVAEILKRKIRLVAANLCNCEECGEPLSWKVKLGNLEHCAKLIAALIRGERRGEKS